MTIDFTHKKYEKLLSIILDSCYVPVTVYDHITSPIEWSIIIRHDVDYAVEQALKMACIEDHFGLKSTYYFRKVDGIFCPEIINEITSMGHEIGYHYETLDKTKGDINKAICLFRQELGEFRKIVDVKTVCMHGNPLASWTNSDIWKNYDLRDFGVIAEPYLSIDYMNVFYLTDTGRTWANQNIRVKDNVNADFPINNYFIGNISTTDDIIELIKEERIPQICILVHPHRWHDNTMDWMWELISQNVKNIGKAGIVWYRKKNW